MADIVPPDAPDGQTNPAETLRRAAALMRERAEEQRKPHHPYSDKRIPAVTTIAGWSELVDAYLGGDMGTYCASWHPGVTLAVAELLDDMASYLDFIAETHPEALTDGTNPASYPLAVARAYLGEA